MLTDGKVKESYRHNSIGLYSGNRNFLAQPMDSIFWIAISVFLAVTAIFIMKKKKRSADNQFLDHFPVATEASTVEMKEAVPDRIIIGQTPSAPVVTIQAFPDFEAFRKAKPIDDHSNKPIGRLNALIQAVPSLLVAGETHGKKLMEVVINGDLVRAADGNGLRPYAIADGRISEQARLFEIEKLNDMINAAAVWQIASVVVAQKHLADISQKLDELKNGVDRISEFLDNQRRARIESTYDYLKQAYVALKGGDLPQSVRIELEACERDLIEIQRHLEMEYRQKINQKVEHSEQFGTGDLTNDIGVKISELEALAKDISLCTKTRIAAWHVLSLFPGDPHLKIARKQSVEKSIDSFSALGTVLTDALFREINEVKSFWNKESTLQERRNSLKLKCRSTASVVETSSYKGREQIAQSEALLLTHDQPNRLLIQIENGQLVEARQAA